MHAERVLEDIPTTQSYIGPSRLAGELCTDNRRDMIGRDILSNGSRQARAHLNWISGFRSPNRSYLRLVPRLSFSGTAFRATQREGKICRFN